MSGWASISVSVAEVAESIERFGDRYMRPDVHAPRAGLLRIEQHGPGGPGPYSFESLAARFAAKEATLKVLRPVGPRPQWRDIEVHRTDGGWCEMRLTGTAATWPPRPASTSGR